MDALRASEAATEVFELRRRLNEAEQMLRVLRRDKAGALLVERENGPQLYTLKSASDPYRMLVEQMREGALTLTPGGIVLYCNEAFGGIVEESTALITGRSILGFLAKDDLTRLAAPAGCASYETFLNRKGGSQAPVLLSSAPLCVGDQVLVSAVVTDLTRQQLRLRYEAIVKSIAQPVYMLSPELVIQSWNPGAEQLYGYSAAEIVGRSESDLCPPGEEEALEHFEREVRRRGCALSADATRWRKDRSTVHVIFCLAPLPGVDGQLSGYAAIAHDITEHKNQERTKQLLLEELNHRVKNTLAMVQSIARFTERGSQSLADFSRSFSGRIQALAGAHNVLTATSWRAADLQTLVNDQLILGDAAEGAISCRGPKVELEPQAAVSLSLVLHELATNACKYGALSVSSGRVDLTWEIRERGCILTMLWAETGGPKVLPRRRRGFGSFIIEESLNGIEGHAKLRFEPAGLMCEIELPLH